MKPFQYPLESLRERARWQLEASRLKLAQIEKTLVAARIELTRAEEEFARIAAESSQSEGVTLDPARQRQRLNYLTTLRARINERREALGGLTQTLERARAECLEKHQRLEVANEHRKHLAAEHAHLEVARGLRESDAEWLARQAWKNP